MKAANRVVKNTGILYARMGITVGMSLYTTRLILGSLGIVDFGIFNVVAGAISMLTFLNAAMASATQRFMSYTEGEGDLAKLKKIFNVSVILHILIAVLVLFVLEVAGYFLFKNIFKIPIERLDSAKTIYQYMVISTIFTIVSVPYDAVINAHENMMLYSILGVVESIFKLGIAFFILHTSFDKLISYGLLTAILTVILLLVRRVYCHRRYEECTLNFSRYYDKRIFKELTSFAGWSFLSSSVSMISNYGQGIVMNAFFGTVVNAAQGIANQVSGQLSAFSTTMQKALNPVISKSEGAGDRNLMLKASMMGSKVSFFLLMLFFIPVMIEMPYIFRIWLKDVPSYAVIFCELLLIRNLVDQLFYTLSISIAAVGDIRKQKLFSSFLNLFPLAISYYLFSLHYPAYVSYLVFIGYSILNAFVILYFAKRVCNLSISEYFKTVATRCIVSFVFVIIMSYIPLFLMAESFLRFILVISISFLSFGVFVWIVGFTKEERKLVIGIFKGFLGKISARA